MNTKEKLGNEIDKLDKDFDKLVTKDKLDINSIENLAINSFEDIKCIVNNHIEELIIKKIDEKELISKKNKNGKKKDSN